MNNSTMRLRAELRRIHRETFLISLFANQINELSLPEWEAQERELIDGDDDTVRKMRGRARQAIAHLRASFEVSADVEELEAFLRAAESPNEGWANHFPGSSIKLQFVQKARLQQLFPQYGRVLPVFDHLPPHAFVSIDIHCQRRNREVTVNILEAELLEDMAALWNAAVSAHASIRAQGDSPVEWKTTTAILRATARAAFALLEGYLNGIAYDVLLTRDPTPEENELLTEWSSVGGRPKLLSLQRKIVTYPRVALRMAHSPVQRSNCPPLERVLAAEEEIRHTLIHPTPRKAERPTETDREIAFRRISPSLVADLCDDVIETICSIDAAMNGTFGTVAPWIRRRGTDGRFPNDTFE